MIQQVYHKIDESKDKLYNEYKKKLRIQYPLKENYNPVIPLNIYQTWHTKQLPEKMFKTIIYFHMNIIWSISSLISGTKVKLF